MKWNRKKVARNVARTKLISSIFVHILENVEIRSKSVFSCFSKFFAGKSVKKVVAEGGFEPPTKGL